MEVGFKRKWVLGILKQEKEGQCEGNFEERKKGRDFEEEEWSSADDE